MAFFGVVAAGLPPLIQPSSSPSETSFLYTFTQRSHVAVFLLPGVTLPPNTAAAVYIAVPPSPSSASPFKFLGGIGPGKESAIFKINGSFTSSSGIVNNGEVDMDAPEDATSTGDVTLGISIETVDSVSAQMAALSALSAGPSGDSRAVVPVRTAPIAKPDTLILAQRIIKNAFNFLAGFSTNAKDGVEVTRLFEEWWKKFETRLKNDPGFLERDGD